MTQPSTGLEDGAAIARDLRKIMVFECVFVPEFPMLVCDHSKVDRGAHKARARGLTEIAQAAVGVSKSWVHRLITASF